MEITIPNLRGELVMYFVYFSPIFTFSLIIYAVKYKEDDHAVYRDALG